MTEQIEIQSSSIKLLPPLSEEELGDAEFRAKDLAWSALIDLFEQRKEQDPGISYETIGCRIGRQRSQVQRWLYESRNMTLRSLGVLAESLDAEIDIVLTPRDNGEASACANYAHPRERAAEAIAMLPLGNCHIPGYKISTFSDTQVQLISGAILAPGFKVFPSEKKLASHGSED